MRRSGALVAVSMALGLLAVILMPVSVSFSEGERSFDSLLVGDVSSGTLTHADGPYTYTPNADFNGSDSFTHKANDGLPDSNVAQASITVVAEAGIALSITDSTTMLANASADAGQQVTMVVSASGTETMAAIQFDVLYASTTVEIVSAVQGTPISGSTFAAGTGVPGVVTIVLLAFQGRALGLADIDIALITFNLIAAPGGSATLTFANVLAADASLNPIPVNLTGGSITITPTAADDAYSVDEGSILSVEAALGVLANDIDDGILTAVKVTDPANGTITLNGNGSFVYAHDGSETTSDSFTYKANDGLLDSNIATVNITVRPDTDEDGVADHVEDAGPNAGDGNQDAVLDSAQADVASLPNANNGQYVTVAITSSLPTTTTPILLDVNSSEPPAGAPTGVDFPIGMVGFRLVGVTTTTVEIIPASAVMFGTYYKFGPEPGDTTDHWYEFVFDGTTGAETQADRVVLHFVDGHRGDHDLTVNGEILDPGALATAPTTFTVNSNDDVDDSSCDATHCSLREAITASNAGPSTDTIAFNIPGAGPHTIRPLSALPTITDPVTIDGYTQPGASPNTSGPGLGLNTVLMIELDGTNAGAGANGLRITSGDSTVRGLVINRFGGPGTQFSAGGVQLDGTGGNVIEGNFIGTDDTGTSSFGNSGSGIRITSPDNMIGGATPAATNVISGNGFNGVFITFVALGGNIVQGNFLGTDVTGTIALGNSFEGVRIVNSPNNTIGGTTAGARNIISGNQNGLSILGDQSAGNVVRGNFIGTDVTGLAAVGNSTRGVYVDGSNNTVGGTTVGAGNIISGNGSDGVVIAGVFLTGAPVPGGATGNVVQGNFIGTDLVGTAALSNGGNGVFVNAASGSIIGGPTAAARNVIAFNANSAVRIIAEGGTGNAILGNAIFSNTGLGIDLGPGGVTPNDPGDGDTGSNNLQNFPVLTSAIRGSATIEGTLNSTSNTQFMLELFSNSACDPSGNGEGEKFLGFTNVTTDGSGNASFTVAFPTTVPAGQFITATATDPDGNTSEFSQCLIVDAADLSISKADAPDPVSVGATLTYTVTVTNDGPTLATGVTLTDTLPAGVTFISATTTPGSCSEVGGSVTCTLGALASNATTTVTIVVTPNSAGAITNTASVTSNEPDPNTANNTAAEDTLVVPAPTVNEIVNGDFETGGFHGWTQINSGSGEFVTNDGTFDPPGPDGPLPPLGGSFAAETSQSGPGRHTLFQDVALSADLTIAALSWADRIRNHAGLFSDPNQEFRVEIWNTSNEVLAEIFSTNPGDALLNDWVTRAFDISTFIGQTIRIAFTQEDNLFFFNLHLDNVSLSVSTGDCGDLNDDGLVNVFDAIIDLQIIVGQIEPTLDQLLLGDLNRDGTTNVFDVILVLQHIVGLTELTGCGPPVPQLSADILSLISPEEGAILDNGRTDRLDNIVWDFDWSDSAGATRYHLFVEHSGALIPVINNETISTSSYHHVNVGSFIVESFRFNWTWKVRAEVGGVWGEWSETRTFDVEPVNTDPAAASAQEVVVPAEWDKAYLRE